MTTYAPVTGIAFQYGKNLNYWLKFYEPNTTTPVAMSIDAVGSTLLAKAEINNTGFPTTDGTTIFIPHLAQSYDAYIFPTEAEADANDTVNALRVAESINPFNDDFSVTKYPLTVVEGQTVYPLPFNVSNEAVVIVDGRTLQQTSTPPAYSFNPNGDLVLSESLFAGQVIEVWSRAVAPPKRPVSTTSFELSFIADIATTDLTDVSNFKTNNYDTIGDNGGASWSFTGNVVPAKAGGSPELATGNVYDINGREYIYSKTVLFDRAFGVKSSDQSNDIHIDATEACNNLIAFAKLRGKADIGIARGGSNIYWTPRQEIEKTGTWDFIKYGLPIELNNTTIYQQDSTSTVINWEANQAGVKNVFIRWADHITDEDFYNDKPTAFAISENAAIDVNSESVFSQLDKIWIFRGWDGFKLDSQAPFGGLFWQFWMTQCYVTQHLGRAYSFTSISQVSTTSTMQNCHTSCKTRSIVEHNGFDYLALQHMEASNPIEPGVTVGWENYWLQDDALGTRPPWQTGTFYKTFGKGYLINNVQTMKCIECSLDGAHNEEPGNVIDTLNSVMEVSGFHLEGHNLSKADGISLRIGSDCDFGFLYLFDLRLRLPNETDVASLFGGVENRNRNFRLEGVRNQNQAPNSVGIVKYANGGNDITAFNSMSFGSGAPSSLVINIPDETHFDRPTKMVIVTGTGTPGDRTYEKGVKTAVVISSTNPSYIIERDDSGRDCGSLVNSAATGLLTATLDRLVTPIGDSVRIVNSGTGTTAIVANGTGLISGETTAPSGKVLTVTRISNLTFFAEVSA